MTNVLEYLEAKASEDASKTAVCDDRREYTRGCLLSRSRSIGSALLKVVSKRQPVIVFMEKTADTLAAFFGVVYAGACYCMADPQLPTVRLRQIHGSLNTQVILTDDAHMDRAKEVFGGCSIFDADAFAEHDIDEEGLLSVRMRHLDTDPLYVNFTSGSTGTPKGVAICHRSVIDFIDTFTGQFGIREDDVIGNQAPFDFDVSVKDIYSSMKTGARLAVIPRPLFTTPAPLLDFMCGKGVTVMIWAVSALCLVSAFHGLDYKTPEDVRLVMFSGEVMPLKRLKDWTDHLPDAVFVNLYGPTEITCNCTFHVIDRERDYIEGIPIGRSFPNEETFLLDENDNEITPDQRDRTGEICVRGTAVGLGYWNNRQQTQERFREDPRTPEYASIIYCTGDLGRYNDRGELVFCGRRDDQVKYRGHRIELAEIELAMNSISGVDRSCCIFEDRKDQLHGFYCGSIEKGGLAQALKDKLPVYMIPGRLHKLDSLPVTGRGKIDRKALMEGLSGRKRVQPEK